MDKNNKLKNYFNAEAESLDAEKGHFFKVTARIENDVIVDIKCHGDNIPFIKEMCLNLENLARGRKKEEAYKIKASEIHFEKDQGLEYAGTLLLTFCEAIRKAVK